MRKFIIGLIAGALLVGALAVGMFYNMRVDADGNYVYIEVFGQVHEFNYGDPLVEHP